MTPKQKFTSVVFGRNAFTPSVVSYHNIKYGAAELSTSNTCFIISGGSVTYGQKFIGIPDGGLFRGVWAVTCVKEKIKAEYLNELFDSRKEAEKYIESLK